MGLFDHIKCEYPLPGEEPPNTDFQSKSMYSSMDEYTITAGGRLVLTKRYWQDKFESAVDMQFHGVLNFYTCDNNNGWWEYNAIFEKGQLVLIQRVERYPGALGGF